MGNNKQLRDKIMQEVMTVVSKRLNENLELTKEDFKELERNVVEKYADRFNSVKSECQALIYFEDILYYENGWCRIISYDDDEYESPELDDEYMIDGFVCKDGEIYLHNANDHYKRLTKYDDKFKEDFFDYISDENNLDLDVYDD